MASKDKVISEATAEDENLLKSVQHNWATPVEIRGKVFNVKWMHPYTADRVTCLMQRDGNDGRILAQAAALIVLNGFWKAKFLYWIVWRWFYYIKQYNAQELIPLFETAQKKTAQEEVAAYLNATIFLTVLNDAKKQMTKAEAERTLRELRGGNGGK